MALFNSKLLNDQKILSKCKGETLWTPASRFIALNSVQHIHSRNQISAAVINH